MNIKRYQIALVGRDICTSGFYNEVWKDDGGYEEGLTEHYTNYFIVAEDLKEDFMAKAMPGNNYAVESGDTLWTIAQEAYNNGAYWQQIYEANKRTIGPDPNTLTAGTVLYIPQVQGQATTYTVKAGDTLWLIAQHFYGNGESWQKIYDANKQVIGPDPNALHAGTELRIP